MKTVNTSKPKKVNDVIIDKSLNKLDEVVLFPEKVKKAKETIAAIGLPQDKCNQ